MRLLRGQPHQFWRANAPAGAHVYLRPALGQSNTHGAGAINSVPSADFQDQPVPMLIAAVASGSGHASIAYNWQDLLYLQDGVAGNDSALGAVTGPRGERSIEGAVQSAAGGVGHYRGVAEQVRDNGYHALAQSVRLWKVATWGIQATGQSPYSNGAQWKNAIRSLTRLIRPFVQAEVAAGRAVYLQAMDIKQGEAEATQLQNAVTAEEIAAAQALIDAWPGVWTQTLNYYYEKFGVTFPVVFTQLMPVRTSNSAGAPLDGPTLQMNNAAQNLCRYTVPMSIDGTIGTIVDQGPAAGRLNNAYWLQHNFSAPVLTEVHFTAEHQVALGKALVALEKHLAGNVFSRGLLQFPVTRIAPVALELPALVSAASNQILISVRPDEKCLARVLALSDGATAPSAATLLATGTQYTLTEDAATGNTTSQTLTISGLTPSTAYDIYMMLVDDVHGHAGSVLPRVDATTAAGLTTPTWDTSVSAGGMLTYDEDGRRAIANSTITSLRWARGLQGRSSGKYYFCLEFDWVSAIPNGIGIGTTGVGGTTGGTVGTSRWSWTAQTANTNSANRGMVHNANNTDGRYHVAVDLDAQLIWFRAGSINWNNDAEANPATGAGGLSISGRGASTVFPIAQIAAGVGNFYRFVSETPPSGFEQWAGTTAAPTVVYEAGVYESGVYE